MFMDFTDISANGSRNGSTRYKKSKGSHVPIPNTEILKGELYVGTSNLDDISIIESDASKIAV